MWRRLQHQPRRVCDARWSWSTTSLRAPRGSCLLTLRRSCVRCASGASSGRTTIRSAISPRRSSPSTTEASVEASVSRAGMSGCLMASASRKALRRTAARGRRNLSPIRDSDYDTVVIVIFDENFRVIEGLRMTERQLSGCSGIAATSTAASSPSRRSYGLSPRSRSSAFQTARSTRKAGAGRPHPT